MELSFEKWENGKWYVVFPDYDGDQEDLEMIDGADKLLDVLTTTIMKYIDKSLWSTLDDEPLLRNIIGK